MRRSSQAILKEINSEYSLEGLMLKLKFWYFGHLMQTVNLLERSLMLGKIKGRRGWGPWRLRWLDGITDEMDMNFGKLRETVRDREAWLAAVHGVTKSRTWLGDWTTTATSTLTYCMFILQLKRLLYGLFRPQKPPLKMPTMSIMNQSLSS